MLVVSLNIYVGRDFRKSFSPISLLQAGLMSTLEQDAHGFFSVMFFVFEPGGFTACSVPLSRSHSKMCSVQPLSLALRRPWKKPARDPSAVTSDCGSASLFLKTCFGLLGSPVLNLCFKAEESKCSVWLHREKEQCGI